MTPTVLAKLPASAQLMIEDLCALFAKGFTGTIAIDAKQGGVQGFRITEYRRPGETAS